MMNININKFFRKGMVLSFLFLYFFSFANDKNIKQKYDTNSDIPLNQTIFGQELIISDDNTYYTEDYKNSNQRTYIRFGIDGLPNNDSYLTGFEAKIGLKVYPLQTDGSYGGARSHILNVTFNPNLGVNQITDLEVVELLNTRGAKVIVTSLQFSNNSSPWQTGNPGNLFLELEYITERYCSIANNSPPQLHAIYDNTEIEFSWDIVEDSCVEEYELEWTWLDPSGLTEGFSVRDFELNNTRVILDREEKYDVNGNFITTQKYTIPSIFKEGIILFRLREIGRFYLKPEKYYYGSWSVFDPIIDRDTIFDDDGNYVPISLVAWETNEALLEIDSAHENDTKNWQFQASYAENGKKKEVVSYFDGTLRNRQTVTKINTNDKAIVGEVIYDNQGRPAIEVLPVPINNNKIQYYNSNASDSYINLNTLDAPVLFTHKDFDWDAGSTTCGTLIGGMNKIRGASYYYSPNADQTNNWQDNVPDAEGYPFSQIQYTPDNTGRIQRKGGVGLEHQLGNLAIPKHEMKYFYAIPSQEELNRLFGYEVGVKTHYKKNAVVDPNGQISVSYIDPQGRTIATALSAGSPQNLLGLDDEVQNDFANVVHAPVFEDLLAKVDINNNGTTTDDVDNIEDSNFLFSTGNYGQVKDGLTFNAQKLVLGDNLDYSFDYNVNIHDFAPECLTTGNYPFVYDFKLLIKDSCDNNLLNISKILSPEDPQITTTSKFYEGLDGETYTYDDIDLNNFVTADIIHFESQLSTGNISLSKKISVNKEMLDLFADDYIKKLRNTDGCLLNPDDLSPAYDDSICITSCQDCVDYYLGLGTEPGPFLGDPTPSDPPPSFPDTNQGRIDAAEAYSEYMYYNYDSTGIEIGSQEEGLIKERFKREWELLYEACMAPCTVDGQGSSSDGFVYSATCKNSFSSLINDMKLDGQYGQEIVTYDDLGNPHTSDNNILLNVYNAIELSDDGNDVINDGNLLHSTYATNHDWRHPMHYEYDTDLTQQDSGHYYDSDGNISYIDIIDNGDGTYRPEILSGTTVEDNKVEPQFLKTFELFKAEYLTTWAESLVVYHPEFCYQQFALEICGLTLFVDPVDNRIFYSNPSGNYNAINTDGYNNYLNAITNYSVAKDKGLLGNSKSLLLHDPYFTDTSLNSTLLSTGNGNDTTDLHYKIMEDALLGSTDISIARKVYDFYQCNSINVCDDESNITFDDIISNLDSATTDEERDEFWKQYRSMYLSFKEKIRSTFQDIYALNNGCYNGCINDDEGVVGNDANYYYSQLADYSTNQYGGSDSLESLTDGHPDTICEEYQDQDNPYIEKEKRFLSASMLYDTNQEDTEIIEEISDLVNFNYYSETGICPLERDFEVWLVNFLKDTQSDAPDEFASTSDFEYNDYYFSRQLFLEYSSDTTIIPEDFVLGGSGIGSTIHFKKTIIDSQNIGIDVLLDNTDINNDSNPSVTLTLPDNLDWSNYGHDTVDGWQFVNFSKLHYTFYNAPTEQFNFEILTRVHSMQDADPESYTEIIITGSTKARIGDCYIDTGNNGNGTGVGIPITPIDGFVDCCDEDLLRLKFEDNFKDILNELINGSDGINHLNETNYPLSNISAYSTGYVRTQLIDLNNQATWNKIGASYVILNYEGNELFKITQQSIGNPFNDIQEIYSLNLNLDSTNNIQGSVINSSGLFVLDGFSGNNIGLHVDTVLEFNCEISCNEKELFEQNLVEILNELITTGHYYGESSYPLNNIGAYTDGIVRTKFYDNDNSAVWQARAEGISNDQFISIDGIPKFIFKSLPFSNVASFTSFNIPEGNTSAIDGYTMQFSYYDTDNNLIQDYRKFNANIFYCEECGSVDTDKDGVYDDCDNCPNIKNSAQHDSNFNGIGDACEPKCLDLDKSTTAYLENSFKNVINDIFANSFENNTTTFNSTSLTNLVNNPNFIFLNTVFDTPYFASYTIPPADMSVMYISLYNQAMENSLVFYFGFSEYPSTFDLWGDIQNVTEMSITGQSDSSIHFLMTYEKINGDSATANLWMLVAENGSGIKPCFIFSNQDINSPRYSDLFFENNKIYKKINNSYIELSDYEEGKEQCDCIPQTVDLTPCNEDTYNEYVSFMNEGNQGNPMFTYLDINSVPLGIDNSYYILDTDYHTQERFCDFNFQYILQGYKDYINILDIHYRGHPQFLTIAEFGDTSLNYGFNDSLYVIYLYKNHVDTNGIKAKSWKEFVDIYLYDNPQICPPKPMLPNINNIDIEIESNCETFNLNIYEAYNNDAYQEYLNSIKEQFKLDYINAAIGNLVENFTTQYDDKEYQYTLYYYDQAGNLIQTVPPEGVDRKDDIDNDAVNAYRIEPTGTPPAIPQHTLTTQYKYNSLNQLVWQSTKDGGETVFAYDKLGRIIASQNDKQKELTYNANYGKAFSYTLYDGLGRITEAGQVFFEQAGQYHISNGKLVDNNDEEIDMSHTVRSGIRTEVSMTKYDDLKNPTVEAKFVGYSYNSRGRVVEVKYYEKIIPFSKRDIYQNAIYYDYDIHGNVKEIIREINDPFLVENNQQFKKTYYDYDLISGNVNKVTYQKSKPDQFIHKYEYDADNRITNVQTSKDGVIWEHDATYNYYDHGPLARTVLGEHQVQGLDYAYTLQGWLKSVNSDRLSPDIDMGKDGFAQSTIAKDAFAYALHYYQGDYKDRATGTTPFLIRNTDANDKNLYNGNIKSMVTSILDEHANPINTSHNDYQYDQLNRIKSMNSTEIGSAGTTSEGIISSTYSYDRNGNLSDLTRKINNTVKFDDFHYNYEDNLVNRLLSITDSASENLLDVDIDDQKEINYKYDEIGQLIFDRAEGLAKIEWTVSGKVKRIFRVKPEAIEEDLGNQFGADYFVELINLYIATNEMPANLDDGTLQAIITFEYDALGNRLSKSVKKYSDKYKPEDTTYYIRDAQGNVLSIYKKHDNIEINPDLKLQEQNIYGSSRVGLQESNLYLVKPYSKKSKSISEPVTDRAMHFDANYEATVNESFDFNFKDKEAINIGALLEINKPDTDGTYNIAKFESQNLDSIKKLHQLKLDLKFVEGTYKPQLTLRTLKDSVNVKNVVFTYSDALKDENLNINYDVQILDEQNDKYDVILSIGKETFVVGKGIDQTVTYEPYTESHTTPVNKIASNQENSLDFNLDQFSYAINGIKRTYNFEKGYGNPVSSDGQRTLQASSDSWRVRGTTIRNYERIIGDKRYELSNHLGNVLSVISDHKAITNDDGIITYETSFAPGTDIAPWYAHTQTEYIELGERGLTVVSSHNLNGIGAAYTLEANKTYLFSFKYENESEYPLEFGITYDEHRVLTKLLERREDIFSVEFSPEETGIYTLNINIRGKGLKPDEIIKEQRFFIRNFNIENITDLNEGLTLNNLTFIPEVLSYNDYYPFGMTVPTRHYQSPAYRYGFQGQEKDDEIKGEGNSINYKYRMHDPRVGRFFAVDPLTHQYPWYTPYSFGGNKVIRFVELEGLEEKNPSIFTKTFNALTSQFHINRLNSYITDNDIDLNNVITLSNDTFVVVRILENQEARYSVFRMLRQGKSILTGTLMTSKENDDIELTQEEFSNTKILGANVMPAPGLGGGNTVKGIVTMANSGNKTLKFGQIVGAIKKSKKSIQAWRSEMKIGNLIANSGSKDLLKKGIHLHFKKLSGLELGLTVDNGILSFKWLNIGKSENIKAAIDTFNKSMKNPNFKAVLNTNVKSAIETLESSIKFLKGSDLENGKKVLEEVKAIYKVLNPKTK